MVQRPTCNSSLECRNGIPRAIWLAKLAILAISNFDWETLSQRKRRQSNEDGSWQGPWTSICMPTHVCLHTHDHSCSVHIHMILHSHSKNVKRNKSLKVYNGSLHIFHPRSLFTYKKKLLSEPRCKYAKIGVWNRHANQTFTDNKPEGNSFKNSYLICIQF